MDDKQIEDLLRDSLRTTPPEGMRDRTLRAARQELKNRHPGSQILGMKRWQVSCVAVAIAIVVFTNGAENRRERRISAMLGGGSHDISSPIRCGSYFGLTQDIDRLLAYAESDNHPQNGERRRNPL